MLWEAAVIQGFVLLFVMSFIAVGKLSTQFDIFICFSQTFQCYSFLKNLLQYTSKFWFENVSFWSGWLHNAWWCQRSKWYSIAPGGSQQPYNLPNKYRILSKESRTLVVANQTSAYLINVLNNHLGCNQLMKLTVRSSKD